MTVSQPLILFFTDFGTDGPYLGQMEAAILGEALQSRVINLMADAPAGDPRRAAYLLHALTSHMPPGCVVLAVVDPGVGGERDAILLQAGGRTFIGPDNGLLSRVAASAPDATAWRIDWRPDELSATFHGRDLFAPVAALESTGQAVARTEMVVDSLVGMDMPEHLAEIIYIDGFGNAITGIPAAALDSAAVLRCEGQDLPAARTFSDVPVGGAFWYANSCGFAEIAVNQGNAAQALGLSVGTAVEPL